MAGKRGVKRTRSSGLRACAWWIICKNKQTTLADLLGSLNDGSHKHPDRNLAQYLTLLTRAGVLSRQRIDDGKLTSNGVYLYQLVTDLGRKNPIVRPDGIYDPNSQQLLAFSVAKPDVGEELLASVGMSVEVSHELA